MSIYTFVVTDIELPILNGGDAEEGHLLIYEDHQNSLARYYSQKKNTYKIDKLPPQYVEYGETNKSQFTVDK